MARRILLLASALIAPSALLLIGACSEPYEATPTDAGADARDVVVDVVHPVSDVVVPTGPIDAGFAFDFAPPYVATLGPTSRHASHNVATNSPTTNPARTRCLDCHKAGGTAANKPFFAAGTIRTSGSPAKLEVRLKAYTSANAVSAYTDDDGNWFVTPQAASAAGVQFSVRPGVRDATRLRTMGPSPAIGNCNQCHNAGAVDL